MLYQYCSIISFIIYLSILQLFWRLLFHQITIQAQNYINTCTKPILSCVYNNSSTIQQIPTRTQLNNLTIMKNTKKNNSNGKNNNPKIMNSKYMDIENQLKVMEKQYVTINEGNRQLNKEKQKNKDNNKQSSKKGETRNKNKEKNNKDNSDDQSFQNYMKSLQNIKNAKLDVEIPDFDIDIKTLMQIDSKSKNKSTNKKPKKHISSEQPQVKLTEAQSKSHIAQAVIGYMEQKKRRQQRKQEAIKRQKQKQFQLQVPRKPINPYMIFYLQKTSQLKQKKLNAIQNSLYTYRTYSDILQTDINVELNLDQQKYKQSRQKMNMEKSINEKWNQLSIEEKDPYYYEYESKLHKYNVLNQEYTLLMNKKRVLSAYSRFYKKIYGVLEIQCKYSMQEIASIIKQKWKNLSAEDRKVYEQQENDEKQQINNILSNIQVRRERTKLYKVKLNRYKAELQLSKRQILGKYGLLEKQLENINSEVNADFDNLQSYKSSYYEGSQNLQLRLNKKLLKNYQSKLQRKRKRERDEQNRREILQKNWRRLEELKNKQIWELKLNKYEGQGIPREIFLPFPESNIVSINNKQSTNMMTPSKNNQSKLGQKISNSSTTIGSEQMVDASPSKSTKNKDRAREISQDQNKDTCMAPSKSKFKTMLLFMEMEKNMELDIENSDENQMKGADNDHEKVNEQDQIYQQM